VYDLINAIEPGRSKQYCKTGKTGRCWRSVQRLKGMCTSTPL
jgi:hypothetical protein